MHVYTTNSQSPILQYNLCILQSVYVKGFSTIIVHDCYTVQKETVTGKILSNNHKFTKVLFTKFYY